METDFLATYIIKYTLLAAHFSNHRGYFGYHYPGEYDIRRPGNPLYRKGYFKKKPVKYDFMCELKGMYCIQVVALIEILILSVYGMSIFFFHKRSAVIELLLNYFFWAEIVVWFCLIFFYEAIIQKETQTERKIKRTISKIFHNWRKNETLKLKNYVSENLYRQIENKEIPKRDNTIRKSITFLNERELRGREKEIWCKILTKKIKKDSIWEKIKPISSYREIDSEYWRFQKTEDGWHLDEILNREGFEKLKWEEFQKQEEEKIMGKQKD